MDTSAAECAKPSNSTSPIVFVSRLTMMVAVSFSLVGCDTVQTDSPRANAFPSKSSAYSRATAPPPAAVSDDDVTNGVPSVVTVIPKQPTPPTPQPAPAVVQQQSHPAQTQVVASASSSPVKASEKLMPPRAPAPADKSAQKVANTAAVPSAPPAPQAKAAPVSAPAIEALIVKGPPHPVKQHTQGVGKVVWFGLALFGAAVLLLGTRVSVDNPRPRPAKVSLGVGRKKNKRAKAAASDDDVVLPPELEMRETTGL